MTQPGWFTIDIVMHPKTRRFYSSKPPLLPTLLAGEYWLLGETLGWNMRRDRLAISRTILLTINWLPFVLYLILFARLAERLGATDWGRLFVLATACFGTFVSGFLASPEQPHRRRCGRALCGVPVSAHSPGRRSSTVALRRGRAVRGMGWVLRRASCRR